MSAGALVVGNIAWDAASLRVRDRMMRERPEDVGGVRAEAPTDLLELVERVGVERFALRRGVKIATVRAAMATARAKLEACRMLPTRGERLDCSADRECLASFVRAHPNARACSCPTGCADYQPRGRAEFHHMTASRPGAGSF